MDRSNNPSAIRSRKMIIKALVELMEKRKYEDITITDLVKSAELGRKTFYRHFQSKTEVLEYFFDLMFPEFQNELLESMKDSNNRAYAIVKAYFEFWKRRFSLLRYLIDNGLMDMLLKKLHETVSKLNYDILISVLDERDVKYSVSFFSGGLWMLLYQWADNGGIESPDEMANLYISFTRVLPLNRHTAIREK